MLLKLRPSLKCNWTNYVYFVVFLFCSNAAFSQSTIAAYSTEIPKFSFSLGAQPGIILPTSAFVRGRNANREPMWFYEGVYARMSFGTSGKKAWQQIYNNPGFGFGAYAANLHNKTELGYPYAAFGFIDIPVVLFKKQAAVFEFGVGLAYNWKYYSPANPWNMSFGMPASVFLDFSLSTEYKLNANTRLQAGISSTHYSNGGLKQPNHGITTFTPKLSIFFDSKQKLKQATAIELEEFKPDYEFEISVLSGIKNVLINLPDAGFNDKYNGRYFSLFGATAAVYKNFSRKGKFGIGLNATFNSASNLSFYWLNEHIITHSPGFSYQFHASIFPSYEISMHRAAAFIQPAIYIFKRNLTDKSGWLYGRTGIRYYVFKNMYVGVNLKMVEGFFPDYLEWNIGVGRIKFKK